MSECKHNKNGVCLLLTWIHGTRRACNHRHLFRIGGEVVEPHESHCPGFEGGGEK
jgi:hypothetical protein